MLLKVIFSLLFLLHTVFSIPPNDKTLYEGEDRQDRRRKQRPCAGRSNDREGRTFLDWSFQFIDVDYTYNTNYNIECGGGNQKPQKPTGGGNHQGGGGLLGGNHQGGGLLGGHHQGGGLLGNHQGGGLLGNHQGGLLQGGGLLGNHQGGGGLLGNLLGGGGQSQGGQGGPASFVQTQTQGIFGNGGLLDNVGQNVGSLWPQGGGIFGGNGVGSLFQGGLLNGIFNRPSSGAVASPPVAPQKPSYEVVEVTTPIVGGGDPDDTIYNDGIDEDHDAVVPDAYYNAHRPLRPGQYFTAYNPVFGEFVQDLSEIEPSLKRFNRKFNKFVGGIVGDLFRR